MKKSIVVTIMAMVVLLAVGQVSAAEFKATMKMGSTQPSDHPYMVGAQKFSDLIKQRTNGRIVINLYPSSQLGKGEREMVESMKQGIIELVVSSTGPLGGFSPSINILDIPYLFRDYAHVDAVLDGPIGRQLLTDMDKHGIVGMAFWENGFPPPDELQGRREDRGAGQGPQDPHNGEQGAPACMEDGGPESHADGMG